MAEDSAKSPAEHVAGTLAKLKEMRHYAKTNVEQLTALWLLFDGELSKLKKTTTIDNLMTRQGELHDALDAAIGDLQETLESLQPKVEEG